MTQENTALLEALECDRIAAFKLWKWMNLLRADDYRAATMEKSFMAGERDHKENVQSFARHRVAALSSPTQSSVEAELLDRAERAWQRFFYPAADCFSGPIGDKLPSVDLEVADCLRLVLASVGRLVVTPDGDVPAPTTDSLTADAAAVREAAAIAARDAMVAMEWPPQDGDRQIDEVMASIRALPLPAQLTAQRSQPGCNAQTVPADVAELVVAAREAVQCIDSLMPCSPDELQALDKALEPFACRVCWDDEGGSLPDAHAVPCSCEAEKGK